MNLQKGRSDGGGSAASSMIKSAIWRGRRKRLRELELHTCFCGGSSQFIGFDSQISILILGIISVFPY